jgi:hypothetical protein
VKLGEKNKTVSSVNAKNARYILTLNFGTNCIKAKEKESRSRPTSTYGVSSLSTYIEIYRFDINIPSNSSATTSTTADVAEFEKMINDLDAPKQDNKRSSSKKSLLKYSFFLKDKPNLDELDSLISSFEKKPGT